MRKMFKIILVVALIFTTTSLNAQTVYKLDKTKSAVTVIGTSSLHEWHMNLTDYVFDVDLAMEGTKLTFSKVDLSFNPIALKSENSIMDKKAYDALKTSKYKKAEFSVALKQELTQSGSLILGNISGDLLLAGTKKRISSPMKGTVDQNGNIVFKGKVIVKMSDFGIEAPVALMGTLKTGDEVVIEYQFQLNKTTNMAIVEK